MQEQLSHLMEDLAELKEKMSLTEGKITEHGKNSETQIRLLFNLKKVNI